jgi:ApeA N-terminal domain 1
MRNSQATILEKRGSFWWDGEAIPDDHIVPGAAASGLLKIDDNGLAKLDLEGSLLHPEFPSGLPFDPNQVDLNGRCLAGRITEDGTRVYLRSVSLRDHEQNNRTIMSEQYRAQFCLVGFGLARSEAESFRFSAQYISLKGLEEWKRGDAIEVNLSEVEGLALTQEVRYVIERDSSLIDGGTLLVRSDVHRSPMFPIPAKSREVTFLQEDWLDYSPTVPATPEEMSQEFSNLEEFLAILTGVYYHLDWPILISGEGANASSYTLYFWRNFDNSPSLELRDIWTIYPQIREHFGSLYSSWKKKRPEYGPGFYLYLGTLRSSAMYAEHRFVNLIWGLESLHRRRNSEPKPSSPISGRIETILQCVRENIDRKTESWLRGKLKFAAEPTLEARIFDVFSSLPLGLEKTKLRGFAKRCADRRNEISHFGGSKPGEGYDNFLKDLIQLSNAISYLYHAALLNEIGLKETILRACFYEHPIAHRIRWALDPYALWNAGA